MGHMRVRAEKQPKKGEERRDFIDLQVFTPLGKWRDHLGSSVERVRRGKERFSGVS
jgi:hypothetical protein